MIKRIYAKGFKGLDFDQPLGARTLLTGRVGSGKSSRALALSLLATGELIGTVVGKVNAAIFKAVGGGDSLTVGVELDDGTTLERSYKPQKDGNVRGTFRHDGDPIPKQGFELEISKQGLAIADVSAFLGLSDAKKVDELFRIFPPSGDVRGINADIAKAKERIARIEEEIRGKEQACKSINETIASLHLPAGSLPEVQAEIAKVEREMLEARDDLTRERERLRLERKSAADREREAAQPLKVAVALTTNDIRNMADEDVARMPPIIQVLAEDIKKESSGQHASPAASALPTARQALERVLSALQRAGCDGCAARMVLRRELRRLEDAHA